jgi:hypothetical protein
MMAAHRAGKSWAKVYSDQPIANAQLAFGGYTWDEPTGIFMPHDVMVLTLRGAEIEEITAFLTPDAFAHFGLPQLIRA